ncbi:hypothetical protein [Streptomyces sp. NPDC018711]|uniref:hypothetical protein n=1 Tax=Streptomyces sp. NPDC018711 TaxID=3365052 RepID=UPI0037B6D0C2
MSPRCRAGRVYQACADTARHLARQIADMGPFTLLYDGDGALPAVSYTLTDPESVGRTLYDLFDQLRMRGRQDPSYPLPLPPGRQETVIQRVLVRHGVDRDEIELLADDIRRAIKRFDAGHRAPPTASASTTEPAPPPRRPAPEDGANALAYGGGMSLPCEEGPVFDDEWPAEFLTDGWSSARDHVRWIVPYVVSRPNR